MRIGIVQQRQGAHRVRRQRQGEILQQMRATHQNEILPEQQLRLMGRRKRRTGFAHRNVNLVPVKIDDLNRGDGADFDAGKRDIQGRKALDQQLGRKGRRHADRQAVIAFVQLPRRVP